MITILSGSPRKGSNTLRVAKAIQTLLLSQNPDEAVRIIDYSGYDIPSASQGFVDPNNLTEWQKDLVQSTSDARVVFVLTPEYNWFPSAEIIQTIHVMASRHFQGMWDNKIFATAGVSNGRGGRMPAVQLSYAINKIINVFNFESLVGAKMFESQFTDKALDENGASLGNDEYMKGLKAFVDFNMKLSERWHSAK